MALKKMAFGLIKSKLTGVVQLTDQPFEKKKDVRDRYPKQDWKLVLFPVKFDAEGYIDFDPTLDTDIGD